MGGPTFLNEKVSINSKKNNVVLNFETKVRQTLSLYAFKLILTNIQSEIIDKSVIISTERWTVLAQPTQRWASLLLSMEE